MRLLAALALLLQLQPLAGSAICFHDAEMARSECTMPQQHQRAGDTVAPPSTGMPLSCPSMKYCAPAAPTVPNLPESLQIVALVHGAPALSDLSLAPGDPPAPPFDPPRV